MEYLITPPETTDWQVNLDSFKDKLKKDWSNLSIKVINNLEDYYCIEWMIDPPETQTRLDGALHRDKQGISLDGSLEDCAKFALWFRSFVPSYQKLIFYDQGYNSQIDLYSGVREGDIIKTFSTLMSTGFN
jgi:hypothetical protein